jgi:hypothetical protein
VALSWAGALAWRMRRHLLDPAGAGSVEEVVGRLGAVPAWPAMAAELAIGVRRRGGTFGDAARALAEGRVVKVFAFHGALHLMTPQAAGAYLAVRASGRMWERPSWQTFYELAPSDWPPFREHVRNALGDGPLTLSELVAALARRPRYRRVATIIAEGNETVLKPLSWQGDIGLGVGRDGEPTFLRLDSVPGWAEVPDLDEAGPALVTAYLSTYGPARTDQVVDRFGKGLGAQRRDLRRWIDQVVEQCEAVSIEGDRVLVLAEDLDELRATSGSPAVRLLPGRDPWVMAIGTSDTRVVPAARRRVVSRSANLVVSRGLVAGTWTLRGGRLEVSWFEESGRVPRTALDRATTELARLLDRPLDVAVRPAP